MTKTSMAVMVFVSTIGAIVAIPTAEAAPCLIVTLTGTQSGPAAVNGLAGAGTLVRYGDDSDNCSAVKLQFDAGRGTNMRLSQVGVPPGQLNAVFFTHMHSDHTEGFADIMQLRWHFNSKGPKLDAVCSSDVISPLGFTISCKKFAMHIGDAFLQSGEIAQRNAEDKERLIGGPAELSLFIRPCIPSWARIKTAECRRQSSIVKAQPPILAPWRSELVQNISCLRIWGRRSGRCGKAPIGFRVVL